MEWPGVGITAAASERKNNRCQKGKYLHHARMWSPIKRQQDTGCKQYQFIQYDCHFIVLSVVAFPHNFLQLL